jgi:preprotein translocase subunit SecY
MAWADDELRPKILFVLLMFAVFALGVNIQVPIPGVSTEAIIDKLKNLPMFQLLDAFGGGALRRISILALGLNPYITASIIMQILTTAFPAWKKELQEGGEYARRQQNRRTRMLTLVLCVFQGWGLIQIIQSAQPLTTWTIATMIIFWTAGAMFMLWLGEQISERGIGNGVSLMIFAGIMISLPSQAGQIWTSVQEGFVAWYQVILLVLIFLGVTWLIVLFTTAQRRIPIQHMRRMQGTRAVGGQTSYLPLTLNMAGVIPIIFAISLVYMPSQFASMMPNTPIGDFLNEAQKWIAPRLTFPEGIVGCIFYTFLIFFFTYFYTAVQYNVEDMIVALLQFLAADVTGIQNVGFFFGTSLLIMVSVALETMRQIEANLLMKQYGGA